MGENEQAEIAALAEVVAAAAAEIGEKKLAVRNSSAAGAIGAGWQRIHPFS